jgi:vacuolar-type H+-ATPase catalytic subunit A/Vma1
MAKHSNTDVSVNVLFERTNEATEFLMSFKELMVLDSNSVYIEVAHRSCLIGITSNMPFGCS